MDWEDQAVTVNPKLFALGEALRKRKAETLPHATLAQELFPSDVRTFVSTLFGAKSPITEANFSPAEQERMLALIRNSRNTLINNRVYDLGTGDETKKALASGYGNVKYFDYYGKGAQDINHTLGRFTYSTLPDKRINIKDHYDFLNEYRQSEVERYEKLSPIARAVSVIRDVTTAGLDESGLVRADQIGALEGIRLGLLGAASAIGNAYIGRNGRDVNITIDPRKIYGVPPTFED